MKYLKLFEELKSETYKEVALKLKRMGHERRSKEIYDWASVVQKKETYEKWSKLGTFGMSFYQTKWNSSTRTSEYKFLFEGQFYIALEVDSDFLWERLSEIQDNSLFIIFDFGVLPANKETAQKMLEYDEIKNDSWQGGYRNSNFSIKLSERGYEILPKAESYFEPNYFLTHLPTNRREALKFHRLLVNLFEQKIELPVNWGKIAKAKDMIEEEPTIIGTGDMEIWSRITNSVKNMPLNYLYRD
jgi:hypothetical protein